MATITPCQQFLDIDCAAIQAGTGTYPICIINASWFDSYHTQNTYTFTGSGGTANISMTCQDIQSWIMYVLGEMHSGGSSTVSTLSPDYGCEWVEAEIDRLFDDVILLLAQYSAMSSSPWTALHQQRVLEIAELELKIEALNCILGPNSPCCNPGGEFTGGQFLYEPDCGCMDNGSMPNTYQNNQGGVGSVTPPHPALNFDPSAGCDDGSCIYPEQIPNCGCAEPTSTNWLGHFFPDDPINRNPNYPIFGVHNGLFRDCVGNVVGSAAYLNVGPYGDTSCCDTPDDKLYNYRDVYMASATGGTTYGFFRGIAMDGGTGSGGLNPNNLVSDVEQGTFQGDPDFEGVIGLDYFVIRPNLKDVHGNLWKRSDFHTSPDTGWTFQIYDARKNYLGTWHYEKCLYWMKAPNIFSPQTGAWISNTAGQQTFPPVHYNKGIKGSIALFLYGPTHIHGPDPIVNYGNTASLTTATGQNAMAQYGIVDKSYQPKYYANTFAVTSSSFAYIKITTDYNYVEKDCIIPPPETPLGTPTLEPDPVVINKPPVSVLNPSRRWFENIHTGPNTTIDEMNVVCLPPMYFQYDNTLQTPPTWPNPAPSPPDLFPWGTIGTPGCLSGSTATFATSVCGPNNINPLYQFPSLSHFLHPWTASHKQVALKATWFENLNLGYAVCGGFRWPPPISTQR